MARMFINIYHGGDVIRTESGENYNIGAACTFHATENTSFDELRRQIHVHLQLLPSEYKLTIKARLNTSPLGTPQLFKLFTVDHPQIWEMVIGNATPMLKFSVLELVVESERITDQTNMQPEPGMIAGGSRRPTVPSSPHTDYYPDPTEDMDVGFEDDTSSSDEDMAHGEQGTPVDFPLTQEEIENEIGVQEILKEWRNSIPFVNRGMRHPCADFNSQEPMPYKDRGFFGSTPILDDPLSQGQRFQTKEHLVNAISSFHLTDNREIKLQNSSQSMYIVKCKTQNCEWRLYAKCTDSGDWVIAKNHYKHSCFGSATRLDHHQMTARMIANIIAVSLRENLEMTVKQVRAAVKSIHSTIEPSYNKLWRGREVAIADLFGSWEKAYEMLPPLLSAIQASTLGTKFTIDSSISPQFGVHIFQRAAWAYGPCIAAWRHLRPVISIDAGHLSGRYKGKLYMACGYDAEQHVLPLAFAIMGEETLENWGWFMSWLRTEVVGEGRICVISDAHAAIRSVFEQPELGWFEERGEAVHRLCSQHIAQNMFRVCKDEGLKDIFKGCVGKMKPWRWAEGMKRIEDVDPNVVDFIMKQGKRHPPSVEEPLKLHKWAQCHDGGLNRWGIMTTNGSESMNSVFRVARQLPVTAIVEATWYKCVQWFGERRGIAASWEAQGLDFSMKITQLLQHRGGKGRTHDVIVLGVLQRTFEVIVRDGILFGVGYFQFFQLIEIFLITDM